MALRACSSGVTEQMWKSERFAYYQLYAQRDFQLMSATALEGLAQAKAGGMLKDRVLRGMEVSPSSLFFLTWLRWTCSIFLTLARGTTSDVPW